jgi:pilus assembly protein CpaF
MSLRDRLHRASHTPAESPAPAQEAAALPRPDQCAAPSSPQYQEIKLALHRRFIDHIDTAKLATAELVGARAEIREILRQLIADANPPLNQDERQQLLVDLEHETFGLGPLEPLLADTTINDILVNRWDAVYVERGGRLERTGLSFRDNMHLLQTIERIVSRVGRRIDESSPMVDARLPDGSRVNAIIPPLAIDGPALSIRRAKQQPMRLVDLHRFGSLDQLMASLLEAAVRARLNILISGGSGSGKTTLLNALVDYIGPSERLVSIEDTVELHLAQLHVVRLETRPPNIERQGEITQRDLVKNALRMRPDRIIVGEVRGPEAFDMLQAMNTGHKGSLTTIHANSPRDALARLETMILMAGVNLATEAMRRQISSAIDLVIQLQRSVDGARRVVSVCEVAGLEEQIIKLHEIARYQETIAGGYFAPTGLLPLRYDALQRTGVQLPRHFFAQPANGHRVNGNGHG